ncbi:MAG: alkaline phosphatase D family protein [Opitutales bacterium]
MLKSINRIALALLLSPLLASALEGPFLGTGVKVGEADTNSVIVWVRLTESPKADFDRLPIFTQGLTSDIKDSGSMPCDVAPGTPGEYRVHHWLESKGDKSKRSSAWTKVGPKTDFIGQLHLINLKPGENYAYQVETRHIGSSKTASKANGTFNTAPLKKAKGPIRFIVTTCQAIRSIDSGEQGHSTYRQMLDFDPHFLVHTGDIVYYDKAPLAKNLAQARAKWNLMFSYSYNQSFHQNVTSYFMKDDHDTLKNDCWLGQTYGDLTFEEGLDIFREQVPMGKETYRTYRWGKDVQIWMTENRDFRSANTDPDGPNKTILGEKQKAWLKETILASDATYKFVISPGPLVGPDKFGKKDNHSNEVFAHEGQELRNFLSQQKNTFVICGDRHWQYCSKDPDTGLLELGCGAINDQHDYGGNSGYFSDFHKYFSGKGGYLGITVESGNAKAEWYASAPYAPKGAKLSVQHLEKLGQS